jgi:hypothetical protein
MRLEPGGRDFATQNRGVYRRVQREALRTYHRLTAGVLWQGRKRGRLLLTPA